MKRIFAIIAICIMACVLGACEKPEKPAEAADETQTVSQPVSDEMNLLEVSPEPIDGVIDMKAFTLSSGDFIYIGKEESEAAAAYMYGKEFDEWSIMDISQEINELRAESINEIIDNGGRQVTYNGVEGYEYYLDNTGYCFVFNLDDRAWEILVSDRADYDEIVSSITVK